ncbi:hypothetical protein [Sulfitobacter marinus]|uniref:hypothetical protein n=1 Tax=Sulfitobacter marinus TaxID=394264 RepID=UPI000B85AF4A|nr:hypothetical protein [Sulfitobacter marinus]
MTQFQRSVVIKNEAVASAPQVFEIMDICGFGSPSYYFTPYASAFGASPSQRRAHLSGKAAPRGSIS